MQCFSPNQHLLSFMGQNYADYLFCKYTKTTSMPKYRFVKTSCFTILYSEEVRWDITILFLPEIGLDFIDDDRLNKQTGDWEKQMNKSANAQRKGTLILLLYLNAF